MCVSKMICVCFYANVYTPSNSCFSQSVHTHIRIFVHIPVYIYVHIYMYACIQDDMYTCIYTFTNQARAVPFI